MAAKQHLRACLRSDEGRPTARRRELLTAHLLSALVHLLVIFPLGFVWSSDAPTEATREKTQPIELLPLSDARWDANRSTEAERVAAAPIQIPGQLRARAAIAHASPLSEPEKQQALQPEVRPEPATSSTPVTSLERSARIVQPAELAHALEYAPTYAAVAARPLPTLSRPSKPSPAARELITGLPRFKALAAAHPEMNDAGDSPLMFVLGDAAAAGDTGDNAPESSLRNSEGPVAASIPSRGPATRPASALRAPRVRSTKPPSNPGDPRARTFFLGGGGSHEGAQPGETRSSTERNLLYAYLLRVRDAVAPLWMPIPIVRAALLRAPERFRTDHIELRVHLLLDGEGQVRSVRLARTSGIPALDRHALEAVARAAPFLPPPSRLLDASGTLGFTYGARTTLGHGAGGP